MLFKSVVTLMDYKAGQMLLQSGESFLYYKMGQLVLKSRVGITKLGDFFWKMRQVLQSTVFITRKVSTIILEFSLDVGLAISRKVYVEAHE